MTFYTEQERIRAETEGHLTHDQFRKCGMSGDAKNFPYCEEAFLFMCELNGCSPDKAPRHLYYAPNAGMQTLHSRLRSVPNDVQGRSNDRNRSR